MLKNKVFKASKNIWFFAVFTILAIAVMILIFTFSSQNADKSSKTSGGVIKFVAGIIYPDFESLSASQQEGLVESLQTLVRKTAHGSIYALLGFLWCGAMLQISELGLWVRVLTSWGIAAFYSVTDEVHQFFIPGRSCEIRDMLIDSLGAALGCGAMILIWFLIARINRKRKSSFSIEN